MKSQAEEELAFHLDALGLEYVREYRFHSEAVKAGEAAGPARRWRFDFAFPKEKFAVEIEGFNGRHQTNKGFRLDLEKYNAATRLGWNVYRTSAQMVKKGIALETIVSVLGAD